MKTKDLEKTRRICLAFPEAVEHINGFGHTTFQVHGKSFVIISDRSGLSLKTDLETQELLTQKQQYYKTPYIGRHGWISIQSPDEEDWNELTFLIQEAYLRTAPKRITNDWIKSQKS